MGLCQGSRQGNEGLSGASGTCEGYQFYVGIKDCIHGEGLLLVAWGDTVGGEGLHHHYVAGVVVVAGQDGIAVGMTEVVQLVARWGLVAELLEWHPMLLLHQLIKELRVGSLHVYDALFILADALLFNVVGKVILHEHPHGLGFHPQVYVFGDKGHGAVAVVVLVPDGGGEDAVVLGVVLEGVLQFFWEFFVGGYC